MAYSEKDRYQANRFLTAKEVKSYLGRGVEGVAAPDGSIEFYLTATNAVTGERDRIGRLDPKRYWAKELIQSQENANGGGINVDRGNPQDDDGSGHPGEPC